MARKVLRDIERPKREDYTDSGYIKALEKYIDVLEEHLEAHIRSSQW